MIKEQSLKILMEHSNKKDKEFVLRENSAEEVVKLAKKCKWPPYNIEGNSVFNG